MRQIPDPSSSVELEGSFADAVDVGRTAGHAFAFLNSLFERIDASGLVVRLSDGTEWRQDLDRPDRATVVLRHPGALRLMFWPPGDLAAGSAYVHGDYDIEGDVEFVCAVAYRLIDTLRPGLSLVPLALHVLRLPRTSPTAGSHEGRGAALITGPTHSRTRDSDAVKYHYDVGNDFYSLWLDCDMTYSCAYFQTGDESIDDAQQAKYEHLARKLMLSEDDRLLDIGCGWGGFVRYAARERGTTAVGITLSPAQAELAGERIKADGLEGRAEVHLLDYRDAHLLGRFDKIVSVGMFEHVGAKKLPEYFAQAFHLLRPGGLFMNHGIATAAPPSKRRSNPRSFTQRYVFPDGELQRVSQALAAGEQAGFELRDVESLREHYAQTLRHWVRRLEARAEEAKRLTDEETYRVWRLYMSGSAAGFAAGGLNVYQSLFVKHDRGVSGLPLTRAHVYTRAGERPDATRPAG